MKKPKFLYGFEIEAVLPYGNSRPFVREAEILGCDIGGDSSISHNEDETSFELKSRPLGKAAIIALAESVGKICQTHKVTVNDSCGFHLHTSNKDFFVRKHLSRILLFWCAIEDILISTQPKSRSNNHYCKRKLLDFLNDAENDLPSAKKDLIRLLGQKDRYSSLNLNSLHKHGTIEIRLHAGTTNPEKIVNWIKLITAIYEYALTRYNHTDVLRIFNTTISEDKIEGVFDLLRLDKDVREHFKKRIKKFGFERLIKEQASAIEFMKLLPSIKKEKTLLGKTQRKYQTLRDQSQRIISGFGRELPPVRPTPEQRAHDIYTQAWGGGSGGNGGGGGSF